MVEAEEIPTAPWWVWTMLAVVAAISFWCQAVVTEERLVPALNVIADHYKIPNDIVGATLMAAGASSPELLSSFVSLFITHSSLGLGTIVGSEIFNQLIICAGSVFASKTGTLALDQAIATREVSFYALAIGLLYYALQDSRPLDSDPDGPNYIFISFGESCLVFSGYLLYVLVCANMDTLVSCVTKTTKNISERLTLAPAAHYGSTKKVDIDPGKMQFVIEKVNLSDEPAENWKSVDYMHIVSEGDGESTTASKAVRSFKSGRFSTSLRRSSFGNRLLKGLIATTERPSDYHSLHDVQINEFKQEMQCFLFQRSFFYTQAYFGTHCWHLRWFSISLEQITSVPDRGDPEQHRMRYPHFKAIEIDEKRLIIKIINPVEGKHNFTLMAPSKPIFDKVVEKMEAFMKQNATVWPGDMDTLIADDDFDPEFEGADIHEDLIEFPVEGSNLEIFFWFILFPIRFLMHFTMPDVRSLDEDGQPTATIGKAYFSTCMCLIWLIIGSYAMVASLEALAALMDIPDAVIGFTVSAAGTSLPNYVASKVAAENGFGNQAVSNAFGSNTFNIMVGLGLPWLFYTSFGTNFEPYNGLRDEHILESIIILAVVLAVFIVCMLFSGFVIHKWHGFMFVLMYFAYIAFAILEVYIQK